MDGNTAVIMCERESTDAAGAYPITPSTQMGEYWAENAAAGHINVSGRPLIFIEPEGEHAAAAVTAGLSMTGLRATNFSSGQGIVYMHESLYGAVGKRLTYVLNMGCRAITKATLNVHAGHDDYHCIDDTGFFQLFGKNVQEACDLNIISHKIAELSLNPGICAQDGFLTTHLIESLVVPERALIEEYLGHPEDIIDTPTPAQRLLFGPTRRRVPEVWTVDNPVMAGVVQNQDSYMQSVAAQRPFFFDHIAEITDQCMEEFYQLTGRRYRRVSCYKTDDADYLILGQGSVVSNAEAVADYLRETRGLKVGVVNLTMFRPFPGELLGPILKGKKGVTILERTDQPLAIDLPLMKEVRAALTRSIENGRANGSGPVYPGYIAFTKPQEMPPLYSGSFGMGSRDLQPEALIGAVENMLPTGKQKKMFYLSIDFVHDKPFTPKQEIYQQQILDAYPHVKDLAVHGSENPNLMPKGSVTVRFHSIGGWGAITTGKNLAMTLFDLLGYHIKANPKYGSEKKGQPTTYYLSAAPEPIKINCEYFYVDVVLSPDPNVFGHSNPLAGLKKGGVFIIQSELESPEEVWKQQIPRRYQQMIIENDIRVFYVDGFKIAREIASDPELQFRMQGIAFMGAFFHASPVMQQANLTEEALFKAIEDQLEHKFGAKGRRVVEDNVKVVRRGFIESYEIKDKTVVDDASAAARKPVSMPIMLKQSPASETATTDIHRFWEQTGSFYATGKGGDNLTDPFIGLSFIPAATGVFRDMTGIRFDHPVWDPQKCTGCGSCWTICPDSAIPGLVNSLSEILNTAITVVENGGKKIQHARKTVPMLEKKLRDLMNAGNEDASVDAYLAIAIEATKNEYALPEADKADLAAELAAMHEAMKDYKFAITKPFFSVKEKESKGSGGLLSITIDPYTCKGCRECIQVCPDDALRIQVQTPETVETLRKNWEFWLALPNTSKDFVRIDDLDDAVGALETLLLDKNCYKTMVGGDGACLGCVEKSVLHIFTATVEALMQPRVKAHLDKIDTLIQGLEKHIRLRLVESVDVGDTSAMVSAINTLKNQDLTLSNLTAALDTRKVSVPLDSDWLKRTTQLLAKLKHLKWQYTKGTTGRGRTSLGMVNSTGCTSVWASTFPFNPYPFPWTNHLFQDSTSMAMGIFEGHMLKMAEGFKAIRMAEMELAGTYKPQEHDAKFRYFDWTKFTDEEFLLCPPVVAVGGDGALYDIGFQNLSRMMMSGKPIRVMALDTQVYSNTGGQACTSGFTGQVSDMAQYGKAHKGKEEIRKEIGLIAMAHRTSYVLQGSVANTAHLIEGFIRGLNSRRPALFNVHCPCMPEHGIADDLGKHQAKLALESRAYPIYMFNPDLGRTWKECLNLDGNPAQDNVWPTYTLTYVDENGEPGKMELPLTFADFAITEARFRKHFKTAPRDTWNENMVPIAEYLEMSKDDREGKFPFVWAVDRRNRLARVIVAEPLVLASEDRRDFWGLLRSLAGVGKVVDVDAIKVQAKMEAVQQLTTGLLQLMGGAGNGATLPVAMLASAPVMEAAPQSAGADNGSAAATTAQQAAPAAAAASGDGAMDPILDSSACTGCGECVLVNPKVFAWNDKKQAYIKDGKAGPFRDLVKAAEKCAARAIRPGMPKDRSEKDVEKLIKRAAKYNG
ncbi:MAG: 2-oxoacid:acceptor oxidoreductase family protein [Candidatus Hydrogenedentes bacterium]|nr:2-oxoacid:acceptor oxidoreductase family protein [Candidatus Hydrogenedentota bacterium]